MGSFSQFLQSFHITFPCSNEYHFPGGSVIYRHSAYSIYSDPLYCSIPFFIKISDQGNYGFFINYPGKLIVDCGISSYNKIRIQSTSSSLAFYIINGGSPDEIVEKYSGLTGKPFLMPSFTLLAVRYYL